MLRFLTERAVAVVLQLLIAATATFLLLQLVPGDPALVMLGDDATPERVAALRSELGLDKPLLVQFSSWLVNAFQLDFGTSITTGRPVLDEVMRRLPRTIELSLVGLVLAVIIGIPIGVLAAVRRGSFIDVGINMLAVIGFSVPVFVIGFLMVMVLSLQLGLLPSSGFVPFEQSPLEHVRRLIMPAAAIAVGIIAIAVRMTRSAVLEVLNQDFVRTATAKGQSRGKVLVNHVLRNSLIPIVTVLGYYFGQTFGGSILTERIFNWPGLSFLLISSIQNRDYPTVQAVVLVIVAIFLIVNTIVDVLYSFLDPRIRYA